MKRLKLIVSLCFFAFTIASLAFGVYASVTVSFSANGAISFNAYSIDCNFDISIIGIKPTITETRDATTHRATRVLKYTTGTASENYSSLLTKQNGIDKYAPIDLEFDELNIEIEDDEQRNTINISILVTNNSSFSVEATLSSPFETSTNNLLATLNKSSAPIIAGGTGELSLTLKPSQLTQSINLSNADFFEIDVKPATVFTITDTVLNATKGANNVQVAKEGSSVTLSYCFDGTSYKCPTTIGTITGAIGIWTKVSNTLGTLVLSSVSSNVSYTVSGESAAVMVSLNPSSDYSYYTNPSVPWIVSVNDVVISDKEGVADSGHIINEPTGNLYEFEAGTQVTIKVYAYSGSALYSSLMLNLTEHMWISSTYDSPISPPDPLYLPDPSEPGRGPGYIMINGVTVVEETVTSVDTVLSYTFTITENSTFACSMPFRYGILV